MRVMKKVLIVVVLLAAGLGYWAYTLVPKGADRSVTYAIQGQDHIPEGSEHPPYNSNPPTSGWHYAEPAEESFYEGVLPDERLVHNLEHGDIWISYRGGIPEAARENLKKFLDGKVVITRRDTNSSDIALAAWGRLEVFDLESGVLDEQRVKDFILRYTHKGPEYIPALR